MGAEASAAAESSRDKLNASVTEAQTLAAELHESQKAVAARDELLSEEREIAGELRECLARARGKGEEEARRAAEAEALAASQGGELYNGTR
ncbi:unnamed protein product [Ectocarpus sp. CCAP 1310/34]|nr:unnamed protein product [Ectocarpus sp. CCAP 1310/34]